METTESPHLRTGRDFLNGEIDFERAVPNPMPHIDGPDLDAMFANVTYDLGGPIENRLAVDQARRERRW